MNENYTKLKDFVQKRLGENSNNYDIRYWVGYMDGQNALYKKLCGSEEALRNQILKKPISDGRYYLCPCCLSDLGTWDDFFDDDFPTPKYCSNCGCVLDWTEGIE